MFRKLVISGCLSLSALSFAIAGDSMEAIPQDHIMLIDRLGKALHIKEAGIEKSLFTKTMHDNLKYYLKGQWYAFWFHNKSLAKISYDDEGIKQVSLMLVNEGLSTYFFFVLYPEGKRILVTRIETSLASPRTVKSRYMNQSGADGFSTVSEAETYIVLEKKNYATYDIYRFNRSLGSITYIDHFTLDLREKREAEREEEDEF